MATIQTARTNASPDPLSQRVTDFINDYASGKRGPGIAAAQELIGRIMQRDDPYKAQILSILIKNVGSTNLRVIEPSALLLTEYGFDSQEARAALIACGTQFSSAPNEAISVRKLAVAKFSAAISNLVLDSGSCGLTAQGSEAAANLIGGLAKLAYSPVQGSNLAARGALVGLYVGNPDLCKVIESTLHDCPESRKNAAKLITQAKSTLQALAGIA